MNLDIKTEDVEANGIVATSYSNNTPSPELVSESLCEREDKMFCCIPIKTGLVFSGICIIIYFVENPFYDFFEYIRRYMDNEDAESYKT